MLEIGLEFWYVLNFKFNYSNFTIHKCVEFSQYSSVLEAEPKLDLSAPAS